MPSKTTENLKKVSLILFIVLGLIHILTGFLMTNGVGLPYSFIINHVLDIPFAMTAVIYGLSSIKSGRAHGAVPSGALQVEGDHKIINMSFIIMTLLIFVGLVYINIFVPDKLIS